MSAEALHAFQSIAPHVPAMLARLELGRYRRPAVGNLIAVGHRLAWQYNGRGYVDESVGQLAAATGLSADQVKRCLPALEALELWTAITRGGSRNRIGSRRIPGPAMWAAAAELGICFPELSAPVRRDTPELSAPVRRDTPELSAPVRRDTTELAGTERTSAPRYPGTERTGALPLNRTQQKEKTSSSSSSYLRAVPPLEEEEEEDLILTVSIVAEHRRAEAPKPPTYPERWLATVAATLVRSDGARIRALLAEGYEPAHVAGIVIGSHVAARQAARRLGVTLACDEADA